MTDCPPRLRGDLSKWLCEISPGVYVGTVSSRVRDAIWMRVCENVKSGRATMVYSAGGEQRMEFRVHNTSWEPVDFDGIRLMRRPLPGPETLSPALKPGFSNAARQRMAQARQRARRSGARYVIMDLETTGLQPSVDAIVEFGAIRVVDGAPQERFSQLVRPAQPLPQTVVELTAITPAMLEREGVPLTQALSAFLDFIGRDPLVGYHLSFDLDFLRAACRRCEKEFPANRCVDLLSLARRKIDGVPNYRLATLAEHFSLPNPAPHRALNDCNLLLALETKLNEI